MNDCSFWIFLDILILTLSLEMRINNVELYTENSIDPDKCSHSKFIV